PAQDCHDVERLLVTYACEEATAEERASVEQHVGACMDCAAMLAGELRLRQMLAALPQCADGLDPAGSLLAQCRSELAEALDDARDHVVAAQLGLRPQGFVSRLMTWCRMELTLHPAMGAAVFVVFGLMMGRMVPASAGDSGAKSAGLVPSMTVSASPRMSDQELQNMAVSGIYMVPDGSTGIQNIEVHGRAMTPVIVAGGSDDTEVKRVLTIVLGNGQRFDSDLRLDAVDVLHTRTGDADVRQLLCAAARRDSNPGVRLRALEALHGFEKDGAVLDALLDALMHDKNPGVRIEAVNELRATIEAGNFSGEPRVVKVMRDLSDHDPNNYIRLQASAAVRQLGGQLP
ncbi:MAG: HEAT repeat domain-containing protein, partial [Bryobacteraceae bacterium]